MRIIISLAFILIIVSCCNEPVKKHHTCSYNGDINDFRDEFYKPDSITSYSLARVMGLTGLPSNFTLAIADIDNAIAFVDDSERFIIYNPDFFSEVKDKTQNDFAEISILAHEVGHHLAGHTLINGAARPDLELEADMFSGYILAKMGASLNDACIAMSIFGNDTATDSHPAKMQRLMAIENGWNEANSKIFDSINLVETISNTTEYVIDVQSNERYITLRNRSLSPNEYMLSNTPSPQRDSLNKNTILCNLYNGTKVNILSSIGRTYFVRTTVNGKVTYGYIAKSFMKKPTIKKL